MFMASQNSHVEILNPSVVALEDGAFGGWLGHEGVGSHVWDSCPFQKDPREIPHHPLPQDYRARG